MAQSFPALCLRIMTHCVKEEVVRQKRAINRQRGKKNPNPFPLVSISISILSQDFETSIFFKFSSNLRNFKNYPHVISVPSFALILPSLQGFALTLLQACL